MTAAIADPKCRAAHQADNRCVDLPERFPIRVLGPGERVVAGRGIKLAGHRLIAQVAEWIAAGEPVRIDGPDLFLLGEILGCWRDGRLIFAAVELQQALTGLSELAAWMEGPDPMEISLSA